MINYPGVCQIPAAAYHADPCAEPSLSSGIAEILLNQSPRHAMNAHPQLNPDWRSEEKAEFDLGSAAHALFLEGEDRMQLIEADNYRTKAAQEARDAARAAGKHPVLQRQMDAVHRMVALAKKAVQDCADVQIDMAAGKPEQTLIWQEKNGVWCRCRPDWLRDDALILLDYKSTASAAPAFFNRQIPRMSYHIQEAFYRRGVRAIFGTDPKFIFMAQEVEEPHACSFHGCAPSMQAIGDALVEEAIATWGACLKSGKWPGYSNRVHWVEAAAWQIDQQLEHEERADGIPYDPAKMWDKNERTTA